MERIATMEKDANEAASAAQEANRQAQAGMIQDGFGQQIMPDAPPQ